MIPRTYVALVLLLACLFVPVALIGRQKEPSNQKPQGPDKWEADVAKLEATTRAEAPQPGSVLFLGSSTIRLWKLSDSFDGIPTINHGFGGSHVADSIYYFDRLVRSFQPKVIVFYAGDNDIKDGKSPQQVHDDVAAFLDLMETMNPSPAFVWLPIKPCESRWHLLPQQRETNELVAKLLLSRSDKITSVVCDVASPLLGPNAKPNPALYETDKLHLSPEGYAIWNARLRPETERLLSLPAR
jgi:lysophospholipase L1-like esterase